jgi:hypothetical protein
VVVGEPVRDRGKASGRLERGAAQGEGGAEAAVADPDDLAEDRLRQEIVIDMQCRQPRPEAPRGLAAIEAGHEPDARRASAPAAAAR